MENIKPCETITIIVPVYHSEKYLRTCLESLLNQNFDENYEIVLCAFGATKEALDICDSFEKEYPEKIFVLRTPINFGISASRNAGILMARGEYLTFVDSDDTIDPDFLLTLYTLAKKGDYDIVSSGYYIDKKRKHPSPFRLNYKGSGYNLIRRFFSTKRVNVPAYCWGRLYRTSYLQKEKIRFPLDMPIYEDWEFFFNSHVRADKVCSIKKPLYHYISHEDSLTHSKKDVLYYNLLAIQQSKALLFQKNPNLAQKLFHRSTFSIRMHLLWASYQSCSLYNTSTLKCYKLAKKRLKDILDGKEIDYGPKTKD